MGETYEKRARKKRKEQKRREKAEQKRVQKEQGPAEGESEAIISPEYFDLPEDEDESK